MKETMEEMIEIPAGIEIKVERGIVHVKGPKGEVKRTLLSPRVKLGVADNKVSIKAEKATKREGALIGTFKAHIRNLIKGVSEGHVYKLKVCSGHFPMSVSVSGNEFMVKNFLGESVPRKLRIKEGVSVKVDGSDVVVESVDKELAGQTAASIEELTKRPGFDKRIFQDGIYIYIKDGRELR
jgi:large subunit ribosomal protein L6